MGGIREDAPRLLLSNPNVVVIPRGYIYPAPQLGKYMGTVPFFGKVFSYQAPRRCGSNPRIPLDSAIKL
jgi:hypothetical protein